MLSTSAYAQESADPAPSGQGLDAFSLGQITVTAPRAEGIEIDSNTLSAEAI
jgi:iron complex outermembrane receptor protein